VINVGAVNLNKAANSRKGPCVIVTTSSHLLFFHSLSISLMLCAHHYLSLFILIHI